jgi:hypothetical protein
MPRPAGAPFWGEQHYAMSDWSQLSGNSDIYFAATDTWLLNNVNSIAAADSLGEGLGNGYDNYARLWEGHSSVVFSTPGFTYLESTDSVASMKISWVLRMKNSADMHFYDDHSASWTYSLPTRDLGVVNVRAPDGAWTYYEIPTSFTIAELMDTSGVIRFGLVNEGGICDIDYIALRIWPDTGAQGWWEARPPETKDSIANVYETGPVSAPIAESDDFHEWDPGDDGGAGFLDAYNEMIADAAAATPSETATVNIGRGVFGSTVNDNILSSLLGTEHDGKFQYTASYLVIDLGDLSFAVPNGFMSTDDDGVDFIRRPDRHENDLFAYVVYAVPGAMATVGTWTNNDFRVQGYKSNYNPIEPWPVGSDADGVSIDTFAYPFPNPPTFGSRTSPLAYPLAIGTVVALADITGGGPPTDTTVTITLPLQPKFMIGCGNTGTRQIPPQADYTGLSASGTGEIAITAQVDLGVFGDSSTYLTATLEFPDFYTWDPYGTRGGKLKHRLADSTWRTVGVDASGRLKFRSEDLTWWEEVKSSDPAGPRMYLKFRTRWGWWYSIPFRPVP